MRVRSKPVLSSSLSLLRVKVCGIARSNHMTGPKWRGGKAPQVALGLGTGGFRARQDAFWESPVGIFQARVLFVLAGRTGSSCRTLQTGGARGSEALRAGAGRGCGSSGVGEGACPGDAGPPGQADSRPPATAAAPPPPSARREKGGGREGRHCPRAARPGPGRTV